MCDRPSGCGRHMQSWWPSEQPHSRLPTAPSPLLLSMQCTPALCRRCMQSCSDPAIFAAGDSASCQWAADESQHWFQMRLWSQVGHLRHWGALQALSYTRVVGVADRICACVRAVGMADPTCALSAWLIPSLRAHVLDMQSTRLHECAPPKQARAMGTYAAHCMAGVQDQVGCCWVAAAAA